MQTITSPALKDFFPQLFWFSNHVERRLIVAKTPTHDVVVSPTRNKFEVRIGVQKHFQNLVTWTGRVNAATRRDLAAEAACARVGLPTALITHL